MPKQRIQKRLAQAGIASRRTIEQWIEQGRIQVNGAEAKLGLLIDSNDKIWIDRERILLPQASLQTRVLIYHKPEGEMCTHRDPKGRDTVFNHLPRLSNGRWISIGRLDINTSGLLLLTNNGQLAHQLMHPSSHIEREYALRVLGDLTEDKARCLTHGVLLDDGKARLEHIVYAGGQGANRWFYVVVMEGRKRLVRRLLHSQGLVTSRLIRVRFGPVGLPKSLKKSCFIEMKPKEVSALKAFIAQAKLVKELPHSLSGMLVKTKS